ncbi:hypothetical protein MMC30_009350 [Trapelia coarctata]|nr:hypothetical protein [Trapelia coarctata]
MAATIRKHNLLRWGEEWAHTPQELGGLKASQGKWNLFNGKPILTTESYRDDFDTTSIALMTLEYSDETRPIRPTFQHAYSKPRQTYFTHTRPRLDSVVCVNVLHLFYKHGRSQQLGPTLAWVHAVLLHRAYTDGTLYYPSPNTFLYFLSRLLPSRITLSSTTLSSRSFDSGLPSGSRRAGMR